MWPAPPLVADRTRQRTMLVAMESASHFANLQRIAVFLELRDVLRAGMYSSYQLLQCKSGGVQALKRSILRKSQPGDGLFSSSYLLLMFSSGAPPLMFEEPPFQFMRVALLFSRSERRTRIPRRTTTQTLLCISTGMCIYKSHARLGEQYCSQGWVRLAVYHSTCLIALSHYNTGLSLPSALHRSI